MKLIRLFVFAIIIILSPSALQAQDKEVILSGQVLEESGAPLGYVNAVLIAPDNSSLLYGVVSDASGAFRLTVPPGRYLLEVSYLGYEKHTVELELNQNTTLETVSLQKLAQQIEAVQITAPKILYTPQGYSFMVSGNNKFKGFNLNDVLQMSPGIRADDRTLEVYGQGVSRLYINDRVVSLTGPELAEYLKTFPAENIQKVEVVLRSGSEEDAQAMGSRMLRITTKPILENGGMMTAGTSLESQNGSIGIIPRLNLDIRRGKFSTYLRSSYRYQKSQDRYRTRNDFYDSGIHREDVSTGRGTVPYSVFATWGAGYNIHKDHLVTFEATYSTRKSPSLGTSTTSDWIDGLLVENVLGQVRDTSRNESLNLSVNYSYSLPNKGKLVIKADRLHSRSRRGGNYFFDYTASGDQSENSTLSDANRTIYTARADYTQPFRQEKDKLETGIKGTFFNSHSLSDYQDYLNGISQPESEYADDYRYRENIWAAYAKYTASFGKFSLVGGIRYEYSELKPNSMVHPDENHNSYYSDFFPEAAANYRWGKETAPHVISLGYNRGIRRPPYGFLNPYMYPRSPNDYYIGNPYLRPEYVHTVESNLVLFGKYVFGATYNRGDHAIQPVIFRSPDSDTLYRQQQNIALRQDARVYVQIPVTLTKWWNVTFMSLYGYQYINYLQDIQDNHSISVGFMSEITLPAKFRLSLTGEWYNRMLEGNMYIKKPFTFTARLNKTICKDRLALSLSIYDLFNAEGRMTMTTSGDQFFQWGRKSGYYALFTLGATYNFRWGDKIRVNRNEAGNQEEKSRE